MKRRSLLPILAICALATAACEPDPVGPTLAPDSDPLAVQLPAGSVLDLSAGGGHVGLGDPGHTCAVRSDGAVVCWGGDEFGQATPPAGTGFTRVSAGAFHTCGIEVDTSIACWGSSSIAESAPWPGERSPEQVVADLVAAVQQLAADGVLNAGQGNALTSTLERATRLLAEGKTTPATRQIEAFIRQVEGLVRGGVLTALQGQSLIAEAQAAIAAIAGADGGA